MSVRGLILGGRAGRRRVDAARSQPSALLEARDRPVIDWVLAALHASRVSPIAFVGGYQLQQVMTAHPELAYRFHPGWQTEGELAALLAALAGDPPAGASDLLIVRADTVLRAEAVAELLETPGDVVAGTRRRADGSTVSTGTLLVRGARVAVAVELARALVAEDAAAGLDDLIARLGPRATVDLSNLAAPIDQPDALLGTIFRGKARTLDGIARLTTQAVILDQVRFTTADWAGHRDAVLHRIHGAFAAGRVVIRSSSTSEDGVATSEAGRFLSVLDVPVADRAALVAAIDDVITSYRAGGRDPNPHDEVLVQVHVRDLAANGVLFTRELATGAPTFVISIDRTAGRSDVVTSGAGGAIETHAISWAATDADLDTADPDVARVVRLGRELIGLAYLDALDIEFGIGDTGTLFLFQVRPLGAPPAANGALVADDDVLAMVRAARAFVAERTAPRPGVPGARSVFGNMPDWNPAEMIGAAPRPLALSLYQRVVGDRAWAHARARLGYRDLEPEPLILSVGGRPYVDVRASLASFLPATLDEPTAGRWVDACIERLTAEPNLHDKLEFEITATCLAFDWPVQANRMREGGLDRAAIERFRAGLGAVTGAMLAGGDRTVRAELAAVDRLAALRARTLERPPVGLPGLGLAIRDHLDRTVRHGLEPFAAAARQAFVALALLRSLVVRGALTPDDLDVILRSIPTVGSPGTELEFAL